MTNDLATTGPARTASLGPSLTPNVMTVLARAFELGAVFTARDIALIEPIARAVAVPQIADERCLRQSLGGLSAALPSQATDAVSGKLKLATYMTMLEGCDERALAYACRRCLDELDWMPTVHQLKERLDKWVSPEIAAIARARAILRSGRRDVEEGPDTAAVTAADLSALRVRAEAAAKSLTRPKTEPVAYDTPGRLEPHQMRIPNKGDYERLFGIDPEAERAKAEAARIDAEDRDADLLRASVDMHVEWYRAA